MLFTWSAHAGLDAFRAYMIRQWLNGNYSNWQCYVTPAGFATTNNPCETFKRALKRDYTQRRKLKMAVLLQHLRDCCSHRSMAKLNFNSKPANSRRLFARVTALRKRGHLREHVYERGSISYLLDDTPASIVRLVLVLPQRFYIPARNRSEEAVEVVAQFGINYARMETESQPSTGWPVDVDAGFCPCRYHGKFKTCTHLLYAQQLSSSFDADGKRLLANRGRKRRRGSDGVDEPAVGRRRNAGHALQID